MARDQARRRDVVRERALTDIIEKAREVLADHERFVEWRDDANETELRAVMSWPGDERRHADLNVLFVPVSTDPRARR